MNSLSITRPVSFTVLMVIVYTIVPCLRAEEIVKGTAEEWKQAVDALKKEYEQRISDLELTLELMEPAAGTGTDFSSPSLTHRERSAGRVDGQGASPGLIGELGQTDRFSSTFNPAVGLVLDFLGHTSTDKVTRHGEDRFWMRAAELSIAAEIDPFGYGYAVIEGTEEDGVELIEAAAVMNRLPWNFSIKGGRVLADVTKFGQRHDHELPFVEKPGSLHEFIGGSLQGTGVELHQWFGLSDEVPVRWSVGMFSELAGHSHAIGEEHHHDHAHEESDSKRHLDDFHYSGRLTTYMDLDNENSVQLGGSIWYVPDTLIEEEDERIHTRRAVSSVDLTYKWEDPSSRRSFFLGGEALLSDGKFLHEHDDDHEILKELAWGGYIWSEYAWNPHWSAGVLADAFSDVQMADLGRREYSAFLTWKISHFNWLRLQYRFNDLERNHDSNGRDYSEIMLQWSVVLGSHGHGLDW